jgi:hypothetical protein
MSDNSSNATESKSARLARLLKKNWYLVVFFVFLACFGFGLYFFGRPTELSQPWPLPRTPAKQRLVGCGCPLPEGGNLDLEVEIPDVSEEQVVPHHPETRIRREFQWRLTDGTKSSTFGANGAGGFGNALPSWSQYDDLRLFVGCEKTRIVIASYGQVSAFETPGAAHVWTRKLSQSLGSTLLGAPALRCYRLDVKNGIATIPNGDEDHFDESIRVQDGEFTR